MTAADRVYEIIKQRILVGHFPPDSYVREAAIGREFGLSRTPIREALRRLVSEGWADAIPHQGARVVSWTQRDIQEVFELRALLEPHVVARASGRITGEQLADLMTLAERMEEVVYEPDEAALDEVATLNTRYHRCLMAAADSPRLQRLLDAVVQVPVTRRSFHQYTPEELQRSMQHHREIIRALTARDSDWAASVMRAHILAARTAHMRWISADRFGAQGKSSADATV
ncbi:MAG: GntR family transcriptional regulator [Aquisalimonadaceae bacterium]